MYRSLSMYPTSADPARVAEIVERTSAAFKQSPGFRSFTTSVDALMGPGARDGHMARVVMVDFDSLDDALSALKADSFQEARTASEALGGHALPLRVPRDLSHLSASPRPDAGL